MPFPLPLNTEYLDTLFLLGKRPAREIKKKSSKKQVMFGTVCWGIPVSVLNFAGFLLTSG